MYDMYMESSTRIYKREILFQLELQQRKMHGQTVSECSSAALLAVDRWCFPFLLGCIECRRGLAMRILYVCPTVCSSARLSVNLVHCDKTEKRSVHLLKFRQAVCKKITHAFLSLSQTACKHNASGGGTKMMNATGAVQYCKRRCTNSFCDCDWRTDWRTNFGLISRKEAIYA